MKKPKIILSIVLFILLLPLTACLTGDKYYTYQLAAIPQEYKNRYGDIVISDPKQTLKIDDAAKDSQYRKDFTFYMKLKSEFRSGTKYVSELKSRYRYIYTGPYELSMFFNTGARKVIFNKALFRTKNKAIDLREKVTVKISGKQHEKRSSKNFDKQLDGKNLLTFRNFGVIDILKIEEESKRSQSSINIDTIDLIYDDVDVAFMYDEKFTIEYDIDFEVGKETRKYEFIVQFNRAAITEKRTLGGRLSDIGGVLAETCFGCCLGLMYIYGGCMF